MTNKIQIKALTEKGKELMKTTDKDTKEGWAARKVVGVKEKVISEDPYIVETTIKRMPKAMIPTVVKALRDKFVELGATDQDIEVSQVG